MKNLKNTVLIVILSSFIVHQSHGQRKMAFDSLTPTQQELKAKLEFLRKEHKEIFESILSSEQKIIFEDETLDRDEKRERIHKLFTEEQRETLKANRMEMIKAKKAFRNSLLEAQRLQMKKDREGYRAFRDNVKILNAIQSLTEKQKSILRENKERMKADREAFRATFKASQKAIAKDKSLSAREKREALRATFTASQKAQLEINREKARKMIEAFRATLTKAQLDEIKSLRKKHKH